jgi:ABC-type uncharacterized transport system YnjBCD ATPase subunit
MLSRAHVAALATGDGWIDRGGTILLFGPSGSGKSLRWPRKIGQVSKLGSPFEKDGPDDGQTEAVCGGVQGESCS